MLLRPSFLIRPGRAPRLGFTRLRNMEPVLRAAPATFSDLGQGAQAGAAVGEGLFSTSTCTASGMRNQLVRAAQILRVIAHELAHKTYEFPFGLSSGGGASKQFAGPDFRTYELASGFPRLDPRPLEPLMNRFCSERPKRHWVCDWIGGATAGVAQAPILAPLDLSDSAVFTGVAMGLDARHAIACTSTTNSLFGPCGYGPRQAGLCTRGPTTVAGSCC